MNASDLMKPEIDRISQLRKADNDAGALVADITDYLTKKDYRRALQATAYLMLYIAKQSRQSAYKALQQAK